GLELGDDGLRVERAALLREHELERQVEQQVAELADQRAVVFGGDGVRDLVGLFEEVRDQGERRLRRVPRAVPAQEPDEVESAVQARRRGAGKWGKIGHFGLRSDSWTVYTRQFADHVKRVAEPGMGRGGPRRRAGELP